jgi:PKD repeat protein
MHDCGGGSSAVPSGDNYLNSLLVGSGGSVTSPNSGTVFSTSLFKTPGTFLYLWWDEYDPSPNVEYGSMIKVGYTSTGGYTEYNSLHTIEANWGLPYITSVVSGDSSMSDIFGTSSAPGALSTSFTHSPSNPQLGQVVTFTATATGGALPYNYSWTFGDGSAAMGASATHTYANGGSYSVTLTVKDSNNTITSSAQQVTVSTSTNPLSTLSFLYIGLIAGGAISVTAYLAKYHSRDRKLASMVKDAPQNRSGHNSKPRRIRDASVCLGRPLTGGDLTHLREGFQATSAERTLILNPSGVKQFSPSFLARN